MNKDKVRGISVITLGVSDIKRSQAYYALVFDSDVETQASGVCYFHLQGSRLALFPRQALSEYCGVDAAGSGFCAVTLSTNVTHAEHVDSLCRRLQYAGGEVVVAPGAASWGGRIAWLRDPDGHLLELVWNPKFNPSARSADRQ